MNLKNNFKQIATILIAALVVTASGAQNLSEPEKLLRTAINDTLADIEKDKSIISDKTKLLDIVNTRVLPLFNMRRITGRSVGRDWLQASDEQKNALVKNFTTLLVHTYSNALLSQEGVDTSVQIDWGRAIVEEYKADIQSLIMLADSKVSFNYRLRNGKTGWKIDDLVIENLSIFSAYRDQFSSIIKNGGGIDALINKLAEDVDKLTKDSSKG